MKADRESDSDDAIDDRDDRPARSGPALSSEKPGTTTAGHVIVVLLSLTMLAPIAAAGFGTYWMAREWMGKKSTTMLAGPTGSSSVTGSGTPLGSGSRTNSNVTPAKKANDWPTLTPTTTVPAGRFGYFTAVKLSADGKRLLLNGSRGMKDHTEVWELGPNPKKVFDRNVSARSISPDGKLIAINLDDGAEVFDIDGNAKVSSITGRSYPYFCSNDRLVASSYSREGGEKYVIITYDVKTGNKVGEFPIPNPQKASPKLEWELNGGRDLMLAWDNTHLIEIWDVLEGKKKISSTLVGRADSQLMFYPWAVSQDSKFVLTNVDKNRPTTIFDVATGKEVGTAKGMVLVPRVFSGRNWYLNRTSSFEDGRIFSGYRVYDFTNGKVLAEFAGEEIQCALSANNSVFAVQKDASGHFHVFDLSPILK